MTTNNPDDKGALAEPVKPEQLTPVVLRSLISSEPQSATWDQIRQHTNEIGFKAFSAFVNSALCATRETAPEAVNRPALKTSNLHAPGTNKFPSYIPGNDLYTFLKIASEVFLLMNCGRSECAPPSSTGEPRRSRSSGAPRAAMQPAANVIAKLLGTDRLNYVENIIENVYGDLDLNASPFCESSVSCGPCLLELIWSYWHEEAMLVQTTNALALRFQNVSRNGRDPLAEFELGPLRPLSGFIWGYIQDETRRLSVPRRAYEYLHEYGLSLSGKATAAVRPADSRSKFLQAFHDLLRLTDQFYREASDSTVTPDPFPLLIALRDLHIILAEGAHNQFRDLPWTARAEMLVQQWLLSRPETRDFLRGRIMVPYPEEWMGAVDAMKRLQGWTDTNSIHFNDLARFGECLLLSVRHISWDRVTNPIAAQDWAIAWRPEVQGYIHAYRMVTGVMLSDDVVEINRPDSPRYAQPSALLRGRLMSQRRPAALPPASPAQRLSLPARKRTIPQP